MRAWQKILFLVLLGLPLAALSAWEPDTEGPVLQDATQDQPAPGSVTAPNPAETAKQFDQLQQELDDIEAGLAKLYERMGLSQSTGGLGIRIKASSQTVGSQTEAGCRAARDAYNRGDYARADRAIARMARGTSPVCAEILPLFHALVLMKAGRNREADRILSNEIKPGERDAWTSYNLGVAKLQQGDLLMGAGLIDRVGTMPAATGEMLALRDQANLALGYAFLRADLGATARPLFRRVRLDGPYSSRALLGLGWSELAPDGKQQKNVDAQPLRCNQYHAPETLKQNPEYLLQGRDPCSPITAVNLRLPFERDPGGKTADERNRRALKAWQALIERDPADPAVQEALLAAGYIYVQLGLREQAVEQYRRAVNAYESEQVQLERLTVTVRSAAIPAENTQNAWALTGTRDGVYLQDTLASPVFAAALGDYRELVVIGHSLDRASGVLDALSPEPPAESVAASAGVDAGIANPESGTAALSRPSAEKLFTGVDPLIGALGTGTGAAATPAQSPQPADRRDQAQELRARLNELRAGLAGTTSAQESAIRNLALQDLQRRRTLLETYLAQARLSLARLLDPGALPARRNAEPGQYDSP